MKICTIYKYAAMVLGLIFGVFFLLMALDTIPVHWTAREIFGLFTQLVPGLIVIAGAIFGFKKPFWGAIIFLAITVGTILFFHTYKNISNFMVVSFPALVVALLFIICIQSKNEGKKAKKK